MRIDMVRPRSSGRAIRRKGRRRIVYRNRVAFQPADLGSGWCHVAVSYDGSTLSCWLNGVKR